MAKIVYKCHFYCDLTGEWRFRIVASNGRIVAESGEGYNSLQMCERDFKRLQEQFPTIIKLKDEPIINDK
jgi:hypothetical protein